MSCDNEAVIIFPQRRIIIAYNPYIMVKVSLEQFHVLALRTCYTCVHKYSITLPWERKKGEMKERTEKLGLLGEMMAYI